MVNVSCTDFVHIHLMQYYCDSARSDENNKTTKLMDLMRAFRIAQFSEDLMKGP